MGPSCLIRSSGSRDAGPASDRYGLGIVAWELLTGKRPFESESTTAEAAAHINAPIPSVSAAADLPRELDPVFERALAKDPAERYGTAGEFVAALRSALSDAAGATSKFAVAVPPPNAATRPLREVEEAEHAPYPYPPRSTRSAWPLLAVLLLAGAVGGALLAFALTRDDGTPSTVVTKTQRVTTQGRITTVEKPVTVTSPETSPAATPAAPSGVALNNAGFRKMQAGDYAGALPLLERAVQKLQGTNSLDEAYADYNLAFTRFQLGNCDGVLDLLDSSESIQGQRAEIDRLRQQAQENC